MTQYLLSVHGNFDEIDAEMSAEEQQRLFAQVDKFNADVQASGAWVFAGGLCPPSTATTVRAHEGDLVVTDGPYAETKEYLGGFWVLEAPDLDAALKLAERASIACEGVVEVRPFQGEDPEG